MMPLQIYAKLVFYPLSKTIYELSEKKPSLIRFSSYENSFSSEN